VSQERLRIDHYHIWAQSQHILRSGINILGVVSKGRTNKMQLQRANKNHEQSVRFRKRSNIVARKDSNSGSAPFQTTFVCGSCFNNKSVWLMYRCLNLRYCRVHHSIATPHTVTGLRFCQVVQPSFKHEVNRYHYISKSMQCSRGWSPRQHCMASSTFNRRRASVRLAYFSNPHALRGHCFSVPVETLTLGRLNTLII
jgi:hypothetical protein